MSDLDRQVEEASGHVAPRWSAEREHRVRMALEERVGQRRGRRPWMFTFAAVSVALLAVALLWKPSSTSSAPPSVATVPERLRAVEPRVLFGLADGTAVTALSPDARVEPMAVEPGAVTVRLASGAARFSVTPNPERKLRVLSGSAVVTVLGTVFEVTRNASSVTVAVDRGRVHVAWPEGERELGARESLVVPDVREAPPRAAAPLVEPEPAGSAPPRASASSPPAAASWRTLAEAGNYAGALSRISSSSSSSSEAVRNEPGDLLLAADVARLGGQPERALGWLERVVKEHAGDSRAALASFTLGRTLLDQLGRPREAALAFAQARKLGKGGALAQDALAREVEGWSRAGEATLARERAREYVERYPKGRRLAAVKRLGEIE